MWYIVILELKSIQEKTPQNEKILLQ